jgi:hypothetical protein
LGAVNCRFFACPHPVGSLTGRAALS